MLRNILRETVCMRLLFAFALGIILHELFGQTVSSFSISITFISLIVICTLFVLKLVNKYNFTFKIYNGILVFSICLIFGFCISYVQDYRNFESYHQLLWQNKHKVKILNQGKITRKNCIYEIDIQYINGFTAKGILYIEDSLLRYEIGDNLILDAKLNPIDFINHPNQFDYKSYLARKHIYHRFQVKPNNIVKVIKYEHFSFDKFSNQQRSRLLKILRKNISDENSYQMSAALLLGERTDLDPELLKSYSDTGTIHIISVSGLHVGIIFIVLQFIFRRIPFFKSKIINCIVILICIWFYATLTGMPASVIRSALMISFSSIGKVMSSRNNSINHVAGSALAILTFNTNYLFDIGFQLSYLAVLGIMYLQKPISELYYPSNNIMNYIWETTSVSIAAQLFTLPLCWYYFHQFPNYFLLANLIAIPLSSIALYACIANVVFASIPYLNKLCELVLIYSIKGMNIYLLKLSKIPYAVNHLVKIDLIEVLIISFLIFFYLLYWKEKIKIFLKYVVICLIIISSYRFINRTMHLHQHLWLIPQYQGVYMVIEDEQHLIQLYPSKTKSNSINKQMNLWSGYSNKSNYIKILEASRFKVLIDSTGYLSYKYETTHLGNNCKRICLK